MKDNLKKKSTNDTTTNKDTVRYKKYLQSHPPRLHDA